MVSKIPERYIFDAHTQEPVHATGETVDGDPVRREGIEFKWPFLTEKRDYEYFDAQARVPRPHPLQGHPALPRLKVYYFEQTIPWTKVPLPKTMPVKGITPESVAKTGTTRWYTTVRKFWVEPVTGAPVNGEEIHTGGTARRHAPGRPRQGDRFAGHVKMREDYIEVHRRPGQVQPRPGPAAHLVPALGLPDPRPAPARAVPVARGPQPPSGRARGRPGTYEPEPVSA